MDSAMFTSTLLIGILFMTAGILCGMAFHFRWPWLTGWDVGKRTLLIVLFFRGAASLSNVWTHWPKITSDTLELSWYALWGLFTFGMCAYIQVAYLNWADNQVAEVTDAKLDGLKQRVYATAHKHDNEDAASDERTESDPVDTNRNGMRMRSVLGGSRITVLAINSKPYTGNSRPIRSSLNDSVHGDVAHRHLHRGRS